jgi:hypothetical protein
MKRKVLLFLLVLVVVGIAIVSVRTAPKKDTTELSHPVTEAIQGPVTITPQPIKEQYYSGSSIVISGSGTLVDTARQYIASTIKEFADTAAKEVPPMSSQFGAGSPPATYTIDLHGVVVTGQTTTSIVIDSYVYRGGANGMSAYKVFTSSNTTGKILALSDIVAQHTQEVFVSFIKKELLAKKDYGVFPEEVQSLHMDSFSNWSLDTEGTLTIYFDKYQIGPGALGAVAFPISAEKLEPFL